MGKTMSEPTSGDGAAGEARGPDKAVAPPAPGPNKKEPGRLGRAESASRRAVLLVGSGVFAFILGGFVMSGLSVRVGERLGAISNEAAAWLLHWILLRTWLWAILPFLGWAAGRYLGVQALRFAVTATLSGEAFGLMLATASDGLDWVMGSPGDMVARALTLVGGVGLVSWAVSRGLASADAAQAVADVEAEKRKAEYAEFLARAEGKSSPAPQPSPQGERED